MTVPVMNKQKSFYQNMSLFHLFGTKNNMVQMPYLRQIVSVMFQFDTLNQMVKIISYNGCWQQSIGYSIMHQMRLISW